MKKHKVIYSNIQPNTKEAGVWVNTTDGNVMVEKDGKWVDDGGNANNPNDTIPTLPQYIGFELYQPSMFGDGYTWRMSINVEYEGSTFEALTYITDYTILNLPTFSIDENGYILINGCFLYSYYMGLYPGDTENDVKVLATDVIESRMYSMEPHVGGGPA